MLTCFWLVVACTVDDRWPSKVGNILFSLFSCHLISQPKNVGTASSHTLHPPLASSHIPFPPLMPPVSRLLCVAALQRPPKANAPSIPLFFDVVEFVCLNEESTAARASLMPRICYGTMGNQHRHDLEPLLPYYPWRERTKLLEGRVVAAHVGCCVFCVVLCCVVFASVFYYFS